MQYFRNTNKKYIINKTAFSFLEISVVLVIISVLTAIVISSTKMTGLAKLNAARNITKNSIVADMSGLNLWLETTSKDSFVSNINDQDAVAIWYDIKKSYVKSYNAIQNATGNDQPIYDKDDIDGLPGVKFDGVNDALVIPSFSANMRMTLFVVGKFNNADFFIEHSPLVNSNDGFCFWGQGSCLIRRTSTVTLIETANWFREDTAIATLRYNGVTLASRRNDGTYNPQPGVLSNTLVTDELNIGSRNEAGTYSDGSFGEIIHFNRDLTDTEVNEVLEYLNKKWKVY